MESLISGRTVFADGVRWAEISLDTKGGSIRSVEELDKDEEIGDLIFPGFIDIHVHARIFSTRSLQPTGYGTMGSGLPKGNIPKRG